MVLDFYCNYDFSNRIHFKFILLSLFKVLLLIPVLSLSEFLAFFYVKYGSFIPLSETDVLEHLKNKCSTVLHDK